MNLGIFQVGGDSMREHETTLTQKGQVTIPVEIRTRLGLKPRDKVVFELEGNVARLKRAPSKILKWYGSVTPKQQPEDFQRVREEFEEAVAEDVDREG
jgi:AbrB family looped-hinge helix DNA binding protein